MKDKQEHDEWSYADGSRAVYHELLRLALAGLGYENVDREQALLLLDQTRTALRNVCAEFGDTDYPDDLHPADVIEKHLARHLRERAAEHEQMAAMFTVEPPWDITR